ncbi:hypothetical protein DVH05_010588 [Phytophthora capsici]|nr:hypothetical protein DVH05_010588 [Phytophthora capsici]
MPSKKTAGGWPIAKARVDRYIEGKQGYLYDKDTVLAITTTYQSLHEVEILLRPGENNSELQVKLDSIISRDTIMNIRSAFRCDGKSFWSTSWICSHVIAAMSLEKHFKLSEAVAILPTTTASGGQRKVKSSLQSPYKKSKTFTKPYHLGILQEDPLHPRQYISGVIIGFTRENCIYKWRLDYSDEDILYYACEDMVDIIIASHNLGLDVTRSANSSASESSDSVRAIAYAQSACPSEYSVVSVEYSIFYTCKPAVCVAEAGVQAYTDSVIAMNHASNGSDGSGVCPEDNSNSAARASATPGAITNTDELGPEVCLESSRLSRPTPPQRLIATSPHVTNDEEEEPSPSSN